MRAYYRTSSTWLARSGAVPHRGPVCVYAHQSWISCSALWRVGNVIPVRVFKSETERQTYRQNRQAAPWTRAGGGPRPCCGGSGDYTLWSARGPYWGTCRATVNPRFHIKVTGRVKLQYPSPTSPFQIKSSISVWCFGKSLSQDRPGSQCAPFDDNTFSPCFRYRPVIFSTVLSWTTV